MRILKLLVLLYCSIGFAGDLGGGGTKIHADSFGLTDQQKVELLSQGSPAGAYERWISTLDEESQSKVLQKVFEIHILPQLKDH